MKSHAAETIATRASLLGRVKDLEDASSWADFDRAYSPLIYRVARQQGLSEQEAEEVVQETLLTVAKTMGEFQYDPARCSFKTWLFGLTRKRIVDLLRRRRGGTFNSPGPPDDGTGTSLVSRLADPTTPQLESVWEEEWRQHVTEKALDVLKRKANAKHFQMFYLNVIKGQSCRRVAEALRVPVAQVYLVRHRLLPTFKRIVRQVQAEQPA